jgi:hypothetical protein
VPGGPVTAGKTGQRKWGDHRVGRGETGQPGQPQPRKPFHEGKAEMQAWFYANSELRLFAFFAVATHL